MTQIVLSFSRQSSIDPYYEPIDVTQTKDFFSSLKPEEIIRGTTPEDIESRCLTLCKAYIGGAWNLIQSSADFTVTRITGGLTNQLYRVRINNSLATASATGTDVAIKFYQTKHIQNYHPNENERLSDTIVNTILSQIGVGPKVFGIFDGGIIQKFYENEEFSPKHQQDPILFRKLAKTLATVHHLDVPIRKDANFWLSDIERSFDIAYDKLNAQAIIDDLQLELMQAHNPRVEFRKVLRWIDDLNSPIVFCHNDFRGCNILVTKPDQDIVLTDAEYSAYGLRAHDLAYIIEWGYEAYDIEHQELPSEEVLKYFIGLYIEACDQLVPGYAQAPENSVDTIVKEVKIMALEKYLFLVSFFMKSTDSIIASQPFDARENLKYAEFVYSRYFKIKKRLIEEQVIFD